MAAPVLVQAPVQSMDWLNDPVRINAVREADRRIDEGIAQYDSIRNEARRRVLLIVGWECATIRQLGGFRLLGFRTEGGYWETKLKHVVSRSNWYKLVGIAERLSHLTYEQFFALPSLESAELLSRQDPAVRTDPQMLERVQTTSARKLAEELGNGDQTCVWQIRLLPAERDAIRSGVETWADDHGIRDTSVALRLIVDGATERLSLTGFLTEAVDRLTPTVAHSRSLEELRSLFLIHLAEIREALKLRDQTTKSAGASDTRQLQGVDFSATPEPADPPPNAAG